MRILDILKEQGINQSQGWHVAYKMKEQPEKEIIEVSSLRSQVEEYSTEQMQDSHHDLSGKETVRNHPDDEGGNHSRNAS